jgi:hypothetical protein
MRRIALSLFLIIISLLGFGQSQGISYQAIIIDENPQQIPGLNIEGNFLVNHPLMVRFTILDEVETIDYQEVHSTSTDAGGMISLIIGTGSPTASSPFTFTNIDWDGTPKYLKVDISTSETEVFYVDFSFQLLTFVPYAYHKNITATGTLKVDDKSTLQDLTVEKTTNFEGDISVNNRSKTTLSGTLTVDESATLKSTLDVAQASNFKGQVTIDADVNGDQANVGSYPLRVRGSNQGIAVTVDGSRDNQTNFMVFMDQQGVQGRIEGESTDDVLSDPNYIFKNAELLINMALGIKDVVAASTSSTVCVGLGACVTTPTPSLIIAAVAKLVIKIAQIPIYNYFRHTNAGVVFKSKGADYAEYIPKANPNEVFAPGELVGVRGGTVSRNTVGADKVMVVSQRPIVVGNTPGEGNEGDYVKIAFIGQVGVKVSGIVNVGDYIIPSGKNDGAGIAVSPSHILPEQALQVAGVAWSSDNRSPYGYVNMAVGINSNEMVTLALRQEKIISEQNAQIADLQSQISQMNSVLAQLIPNYTELMGGTVTSQSSQINVPKSDLLRTELSQIVNQNSKSSDGEIYEELTIFYFDIKDEYINAAINMAQDMLKQQGQELSKYELFSKIESDPTYKASFVKELQETIRKGIDDSYNNDILSGVKAVKL